MGFGSWLHTDVELWLWFWLRLLSLAFGFSFGFYLWVWIYILRNSRLRLRILFTYKDTYTFKSSTNRKYRNIREETFNMRQTYVCYFWKRFEIHEKGHLDFVLPRICSCLIFVMPKLCYWAHFFSFPFFTLNSRKKREGLAA